MNAKVSGRILSRTIFSIAVCALAAAFLFGKAIAEEKTASQEKNSIAELKLMPEKSDSEKTTDTPPPAATDSASAREPAQEKKDEAQTQDKPPEKTVPETITTAHGELTNIITTGKGIKAHGWGEYRVKGKCLCCDNMTDGDCISVYNTERTDKNKIDQIVDGKIEGDLKDENTYFGRLKKRDKDELVAFLMVEISVKEIKEIKKVMVYSIVDNDKKINYLSNCELGYYDQFNRLQWVTKREGNKFDKYSEPITFDLEKPILTKKIVLRIEEGKNIITEVAVFK